MTVIAVCTNHEEWAIAADSGIYEEGEIGFYWTTTGPKIWKVDGALIGAAGTTRAIEIGKKSNSSDPYAIAEFMRTSEVGGDWNIIMVRQDGIYYIGDDCSVSHVDRTFMACGAAAPFAVGAGEILGNDDPVSTVKKAIQASIKNSVWAVGPVKTMSARV